MPLDTLSHDHFIACSGSRLVEEFGHNVRLYQRNVRTFLLKFDAERLLMRCDVVEARIEFLQLTDQLVWRRVFLELDKL